MKPSLHTLIISTCLLLLLPLAARAYYSPENGRWLSRDPVEEKGGANLYGFTENMPVAAVDTDGRSWTDPIGGRGPKPPYQKPEDPALMKWSMVKSFTQELDAYLRLIPCCCKPRTPLFFSLTGTAAGATVTGHAQPNENLKSECVYAMIYWWWTCYQAYRQGPDNTRSQGWKLGGDTFSDEAYPSWSEPMSIDPYHIAMEAAATVILCDGEKMRAILLGTSNGLQWSWDKKTRSWGGIEEY